jgi:hypothetical protein
VWGVQWQIALVPHDDERRKLLSLFNILKWKYLVVSVKKNASHTFFSHIYYNLQPWVNKN